MINELKELDNQLFYKFKPTVKIDRTCNTSSKTFKLTKRGKFLEEHNLLDNPTNFYDHLRVLKIGKNFIGYMYSPYNFYQEEHCKANSHSDYQTFIMLSVYDMNTITIAVIKKEYIKDAIQLSQFKIKEIND